MRREDVQWTTVAADAWEKRATKVTMEVMESFMASIFGR
jgi:hypothetical protein